MHTYRRVCIHFVARLCDEGAAAASSKPTRARLAPSTIRSLRSCRFKRSGPRRPLVARVKLRNDRYVSGPSFYLKRWGRAGDDVQLGPLWEPRRCPRQSRDTRRSNTGCRCPVARGRRRVSTVPPKTTLLIRWRPVFVRRRAEERSVSDRRARSVFCLIGQKLPEATDAIWSERAARNRPAFTPPMGLSTALPIRAIIINNSPPADTATSHVRLSRWQARPCRGAGSSTFGLFSAPSPSKSKASDP